MSRSHHYSLARCGGNHYSLFVVHYSLSNPMTRKTRAYYQYMLDKADGKIGWYSAEDIEQLVYDLLEEGDADEAMRACQIGLDQHPGDEYLELVEAKVLIHLHRIDEAERLMKDKEFGTSPFDISIRFGILVSKGETEQAYALLASQLTEGKVSTLEYVDIVDEMFDFLPKSVTAKNMMWAAEQSSKNKKSGKQEAEALGRIGAILMDCNCHEEAITVLEKALDQDAYDVYTWQDLSRCQLELKQFDKCANSCEMGLAIDPNNPLFNFALGSIHFSNGDYEGCIENLKIACDYAEGKLKHEDVRIDRTEAEQHAGLSLEMLGTSYMQLERLDDAIACFEKLIERAPKVDEIYMKLATLYMGKGDTPSALSRIETAIELQPKKTEYKAFRVAVLTDLHRFDEALDNLDDLLRLDPKSKSLLLAKAELSMSLRRYDEADKAYRKLLKLKPKDSTSKELMRAYFESIGDTDALSKID